ncbi:hypothetical protein ACE4RR_21080 [Alteribacillus sp. HJP-4]
MVNEVDGYGFVESFALSLIDSNQKPLGYDEYVVESVSIANNHAYLIFKEQ